MAALTESVNRPYRTKGDALTTMLAPLVGFGGGAYTVLKGSILFADASVAAGYFRPVNAAPAAGDVFGGIALDRFSINNAGQTNGSASVTVATDGYWGFVKGAITQADVGKIAYAGNNDNDISLTNTGLPLGNIVLVDGTHAWVDITGYTFVAKA
jgi:hypothetical protein